MSLLEPLSRLIMAFLDRVKIQELCNEEVGVEPGLLMYTPDCLQTQEMCNKAVAHNPYTLRFIPDHFKTADVQPGNAKQPNSVFSHS